MGSLVEALILAAPAGSPPMLQQLFPLVLMAVIFYFIMIRPQQQKTKAHKVLLSQLKAGDAILTNGGIYGKITGVSEARLTVRIADKVEIQISRGAVARTLGPEESES